MKKLIWCILVLILMTSAPAWTQQPSRATVPEIVNRQTVLNNITDFFATLGKGESQKRIIVHDRKQARRLERLQSIQRAKVQRIKAREEKNSQDLHKTMQHLHETNGLAR